MGCVERCSAPEQSSLIKGSSALHRAYVQLYKWCPNQGSRGPRCRDCGGGVALETEDVCPPFSPGDCVGSPHPHGSGPCIWRPPVCSLPAV